MAGAAACSAPHFPASQGVWSKRYLLVHPHDPGGRVVAGHVGQVWEGTCDGMQEIAGVVPPSPPFSVSLGGESRGGRWCGTCSGVGALLWWGMAASEATHTVLRPWGSSPPPLRWLLGARGCALSWQWTRPHLAGHVSGRGGAQWHRVGQSVGGLPLVRSCGAVT